MRHATIKWFLLAFIFFLAGNILAAGADEKRDKYVSLYAGQFSNTALNEIVRFGVDLENTYVYVFSLGKEMGRWDDKLALELEGQVGAYSGGQSHMETNGAFVLRWLLFPWDRWLDTSFAFGNGLSWASKDPPLEIREGNEHRTSQFLYYILVEMAFAVPQHQDWDVFVRIHHRSSVFGLIDGLYTASNFLGLGVRYHF